MTHKCVDWTVSPPTRKTPLLVLRHGDAHVYATVPEELNVLEDVARAEFGLGDVRLEFYSSCVNLCSDMPARIGPTVWKHIRPFVGCISVVVSSTSPEPEHGHRCSRTGEDSVHPSMPDASRQLSVEHTTNENEFGSQPQDEGEVNTLRRLTRRRRHIDAWPSEDEEEQEEQEETGEPEHVINEGEHSTDNGHEPQYPQAAEPSSPPIAPPSPPPTSPPRSPGRRLEKESGFDDQPFGSQATSSGTSHRTSNQIKQEKRDSSARVRTVSHEQSSQEVHPQPQSQPQHERLNENQRLVVRIAHRPSKQESKFTVKSSTKVSKVVSGACKSFGLDAKRATLYLIVDIVDEDGVTENFFPCHMDDTMARVGAEYDTESRFLLEIAGDP